ncbi:MAG TPA: type IX secretion system membrane protein PorP/SprF [Flavobacteriales bacterium]|jgi:type IX secretion system PorP/SprF family membrane protein|nr:type IX secretion system membrane protein PorP/SprF [Flavobacteriales bacterium]HQW86130.1 type IX secretion system membrane protein PorP/SprF [Flavobacteriales bacterium]
MKLSLPLVLALAPAALLAQDPQLSQFFAAPMYLNPALTGNTYQDRIAMNYRNQWPSAVVNAFQTYTASYEHRSQKLNSGFGVMAMRDVAGANGLAFTQVAAAYSYEARINRKSAFRGGVRAAWTNRSYDPNSFLFADQVIRDNAATSIESGFVQQVSYMDLSAGGLYYNERFWAGFSVNHLNRPQQSLFLTGDARLPMRTSVHTGYRFPLDGQRMIHSNTVGTFATHYKAQGKWDQFDVGFYVDHDKLLAGIWYRGIPGLKAYAPGYPNNDAVVLMAGYETPLQLRIVYSYDITISWLDLSSGGAHEVSLTYEWPRKAKARKHKIVPCPKF